MCVGDGCFRVGNWSDDDDSEEEEGPKDVSRSAERDIRSVGEMEPGTSRCDRGWR